MSETTRKRIELETTAKGDRLWLNETRCKRIIAVINDIRLIAKHAEDGSLGKHASDAGVHLFEVALAHDLIRPATVSEDAEPTSPDDAAHADAAKALEDQTP